MSASLGDVNTAFSDLLGSVLTFLPWVFGIYAVLWLFGTVIGPMVSDMIKARSEKRAAAIEKSDAAERRRAQLVSISILCSDFDDWLETHILALQIDCASYPQDQALVDTLALLVAAKKETSDLIIRLQDGRTTYLSDDDNRAVSEKWTTLEQQLKKLPKRNAA